MDTVYLISLIVGGFFVLLSIFGGGESDTDVEADMDTDFDADTDFDTGPGLVDLLSLRALFLFAAFFGLTGTVLTWLNSGEPMTLLLSVLTGLAVGLGGNYVIKRLAYEHVSSEITLQDLQGKTARVLLPFQGAEKGKIALVARGHRLQLVARALDNETAETFRPGDEVVVVRLRDNVAEVVKPN
ncbi:hypothetical protein GQ464_011620 [Rhodocaloribacter litoris]|uniref:hypothetical protein n=1 Tax=Rhodocaloribacter litoris TaxID=2558931 RepID=UPI001423ACCD|nr:hypothetical protein [Rhodocaloribacter litoris]QXD14107.1 hypothetical protein GQ464_011620 [Rhodocaloribacter litoris]